MVEFVNLYLSVRTGSECDYYENSIFNMNGGTFDLLSRTLLIRTVAALRLFVYKNSLDNSMTALKLLKNNNFFIYHKYVVALMHEIQNVILFLSNIQKKNYS